jgi:hypothetical protein
VRNGIFISSIHGNCSERERITIRTQVGSRFTSKTVPNRKIVVAISEPEARIKGCEKEYLRPDEISN